MTFAALRSWARGETPGYLVRPDGSILVATLANLHEPLNDAALFTLDPTRAALLAATASARNRNTQEVIRA